MYKIQTTSKEETMDLAARLAQLLSPGDVLTIEGNLGAGKTMFAKGIAVGLGVKRVVTSPTFTIIKEYEGDMPFYHMDAYRLEGSDEDIGFDEYFNGQGISLVEWAQFIEVYLPADYLAIEIEHVTEHTREIHFKPTSDYFKTIINQLSQS